MATNVKRKKKKAEVMAEDAAPAAETAPAENAPKAEEKNAAPAAEPVEEDPRQNDVLPKD